MEIAKQKSTPAFKTIICMDNIIKDFEIIHAELKDVGVELFKWDEILAIVRYY